MGYMKGIDITLRSMEEHLGSVDKKLDKLLEWIIPIVTQMRMLKERVDDQSGKLTDGLVEMAMVKAGDTQAAVAHRGQVRLETNPQEAEIGIREWSEGDGGRDWGSEDDDIMEIH